MIPHDAAYILRRILVGHDVNGELDALAEPWKGMAAHLAPLAKKARQPAWSAMLAARPDRDELVKALEGIDPSKPAPLPPAAGRSYATLGDVARIISAQSWLWKGWIASGVLNALASDPGIGKTRFALDVARRIYLGESWPDGQPATLPPGTRTLWIQGDRNFAEMLQCARDFGLPDDAVTLGSAPSDPFGSLDLDDPATLAAIEYRIKESNVPLAIIDTVGMTTSRNLSRPDEAREFFSPILDLCQSTGVALLGLTHLSMNKEALGRRIVEKARVVTKMTQPDPEGQPDRRRLWIDKTAVVKPPPLGITMGFDRNDYDSNPPVESVAKKPGPAPARLEECKLWLAAQLTPNPSPVQEVRTNADKEGFGTSTIYAAKDAVGAEEYQVGKRKWWKLPIQSGTAPDPAGSF